MEIAEGRSLVYAVANEQEAGELLCENKGDIFVLPGEIAGGVHPVEGLEVTPDKLESLTFSRLPEAEYVSGGTETGKDETGKIYCSAIVPMTGKCRETVANDHQEIKLVLKRSVAKLNLYFAKADVTDAGKGQLLYGARIVPFIIYRNTGICFQKRSTNIRELSIVWKERVTVPIPGIRKRKGDSECGVAGRTGECPSGGYRCV